MNEWDKCVREQQRVQVSAAQEIALRTNALCTVTTIYTAATANNKHSIQHTCALININRRDSSTTTEARRDPVPMHRRRRRPSRQSGTSEQTDSIEH